MFLPHGHVGIEGVVLEYHRDATVRGSRRLMSWPSMRIWPEVIVSSPAMDRRIVDLPQPEGADHHNEFARLCAEVTSLIARQAP